MLLIHRSERADALVEALGNVLAHPAGDPFAAEFVAVPSKGVERWLAQQLSHVLGAQSDDGVCANVLFPSYVRFLDDAVASASGDYAQSVELWSAERAVWPLIRVIDECVPTEPWARELAAHLGLDGSGDKGRRFAVAGKVARLFETYGRARPGMLRAWQDGRDEQADGLAVPADLAWQPELWRRLRAAIDVPSPAELLDAACEGVRRSAVDIPERFSIFGTTRMPRSRVQVLAALAAQHEVHLWLSHPSPALWDAISAARVTSDQRTSNTVARNPLLASMSRDIRELQHLLQNTVADSSHLHHASVDRPNTLLGRLQRQIAEDAVPSGRATVAPEDHSLTVHACHGPARQVEVVREVILGLLAADDTLEPRDVLVMCPDIEAFAPLVAASFGLASEPGGHPATALRVKLADRSLRQTNPMLRVLSQLLEVAGGRVTSTQMLDLAGAAPVRLLFGFDDDDIERIRDWTAAANARWGIDARHRDAYGLGNLQQGTWQTATDRLLLGVAMEEGEQWLAEALPLDDVDSGDIDLAGRFAELVDRVSAAVRALDQKRTVPQWARLLFELVLSLGDPLEPWQATQLRRELDEMAEAAGAADVELGRADVTLLLQARLAGRPTRASFRTGTLTVCTLVPMRSVPHRVVCLLGMDDGAFPRQGIPDGDDLLARTPRAGERDPRSEDRQLFLDAVCAAQQHLVITFTGADPRSGAQVPPCVPLGELLDAVDATAQARGGGDARDQVVIRHPLQPFDRRNFLPAQLGTPGPFSFDPSGLAGARAAARARVPVSPLVGQAMADPPKLDVVGLDDLIRFLQHPARAFLRQRLGISTYDEDDEPADALPVALDPLQEWAVGDRVLRQCLAGLSPQKCVQIEHLRGDLPPWPLGGVVMRRVGKNVNALLDACQTERAIAPDSVDVAVALPDGRLVSGTVSGVRGGNVLNVVYSRLGPKHRLAAWAQLLAVLATTQEPSTQAVTVGRGTGGARRSILAGVHPARARDLLADLVALRDAGLREPLPVATASSAVYAERRHRGHDVEESLAAAQDKWEFDRFSPENAEPEHVLVFDGRISLAGLIAVQPNAAERNPDERSRFGVLARRLWTPLLAHESDPGP